MPKPINTKKKKKKWKTMSTHISIFFTCIPTTLSRFPSLSSVLIPNFQICHCFAFILLMAFGFLIVPFQGYVLVSGRHWSRLFTKLEANLFVIMPQWTATFWFTLLSPYFSFVFSYFASFFSFASLFSRFLFASLHSQFWWL